MDINTSEILGEHMDLRKQMKNTGTNKPRALQVSFDNADVAIRFIDAFFEIPNMQGVTLHLQDPDIIAKITYVLDDDRHDAVAKVTLINLIIGRTKGITRKI